MATGDTTSLITQATTEGAISYSKVGTAALKGAAVGAGAYAAPILGAAAAGGGVELLEGVFRNESLRKTGTDFALGFAGGAAGGAIGKNIGKSLTSNQSLRKALGGLREQVGNKAFVEGLLTQRGGKVAAKAFSGAALEDLSASFGKKGTEKALQQARGFLNSLNERIEEEMIRSQEQMRLPFSEEP